MSRLRVVVLVFGVIVLGALLVYVGREARAHDFCCNSVLIRSGGDERLIWRSYSKYRAEIGQADDLWNKYDCYWGGSCGSSSAKGVHLHSYTEAGGNWTPRVVFKDVYDCNWKYDGYYRTTTSPDDIRLNKCRLDKYDFTKRRSLVTHEIGHSLDFAHPPCTSSYRANSIMVTFCNGWPAAPGSHDRSDYYNRWVR